MHVQQPTFRSGKYCQVIVLQSGQNAIVSWLQCAATLQPPSDALAARGRGVRDQVASVGDPAANVREQAASVRDQPYSK